MKAHAPALSLTQQEGMKRVLGDAESLQDVINLNGADAALFGLQRQIVRTNVIKRDRCRFGRRRRQWRPEVTVIAVLHPQLVNDSVAMNIERAAACVPQFNDLALGPESA